MRAAFVRTLGGRHPLRPGPPFPRRRGAGVPPCGPSWGGREDPSGRRATRVACCYAAYRASGQLSRMTVRVACSPESNSHTGSSDDASCRVRTASGSLYPQVPVALYQEASRCPLNRWAGILSTLTTPLRSIVRSARRPRGNRRRPEGECIRHSGHDTCTRRPLADYPVVFPSVPTSGPTQRWQLAHNQTERSAAAADAAHSRGELNERPSARETTRVGQSRILEKAVE